MTGATLEVIDHKARADADKAVDLFQSHERFCTEREERHGKDHAETQSTLRDLSADISRGVARLHVRMDETDIARAASALAFTHDLNRMGVESAKASVKQNIIWGVVATAGAVVASVVVASMLKGVVL